MEERYLIYLPKFIFLFCITFILGITLRSFWEINYLFFSDLFLISLILTLIFSVKERRVFLFSSLFCIMFLGIFLGIFRTNHFISSPDDLKIFRDTEENVELTGIIVGNQNFRIDNIQYTLLSEKFEEKILVSLPLHPKFTNGDRIKITGRLQTPAEFEDFSYKDFLLKDEIRTVSYYPEVELLEKNLTFYGVILQIKEKLQRVNQSILSSPQSEIIGAMILGEKGLLPQEIKDNFSKAGLSHVLAISGMHIAIIVGILIYFLNRTKLKNKTFYLIVIFLLFYVTLIGFPPSAIRASIMAVILLLATQVHREYVARRALVVAAFFMLIFNPLLLRYDIGFQLSFLAVLGILEIGPALKNFLQKIFQGKLNWLSSILTITLSAQIFTLPIIIYNFGQFSLISPIVNIIVVPILPLIISLSFITLVVGLVSTPFAILIAFPLYIILSFIIWLTKISANFKFSAIEIQNIGFIWIIILYILIFLITWKTKPKN